jgi:hypothetical protein
MPLMLRSAVLTLVLACALAGCSTDEPAAPTPTASDASSTEPSVEPTPTQLSFGDAESVTWEPTGDLAGELSISVDKVREGDFSDFDGLVGSGITADNQPFYVDAVIANEGDADLHGLDVPLYLQDSNGILSPPWGFAEPFKPCDSGPLPEPFGAGEEAELCLVFLGSPGATFESVTFQPTLDAAAVTWTGDLTVEKTPATRKSAKKRR